MEEFGIVRNSRLCLETFPILFGTEEGIVRGCTSSSSRSVFFVLIFFLFFKKVSRGVKGVSFPPGVFKTVHNKVATAIGT